MKWQRRDIAPPLQGRGWGGAADETEFVRQLYALAAEMRRNLSPFEIIMWKQLSRSQLSGFKFRRQHVIVPFIVDFFCQAKGIAIEVDGKTHEFERDRMREAQLQKSGIRTLHFTNEEISENIESVITAIQHILNISADRWEGHPHPNPSPEGEGL